MIYEFEILKFIALHENVWNWSFSILLNFICLWIPIHTLTLFSFYNRLYMLPLWHILSTASEGFVWNQNLNLFRSLDFYSWWNRSNFILLPKLKSCQMNCYLILKNLFLQLSMHLSPWLRPDFKLLKKFLSLWMWFCTVLLSSWWRHSWWLPILLLFFIVVSMKLHSFNLSAL